MGPISTTDSSKKYILVVGDYFTKWKEAFAVPNQEAKTISKKVVKEVISRYGAPEKIHSDQGQNFETQLFQDQNLSILAKYVSDHQRDWDEHLPLIMIANRSSVHVSTQYTPFYLLFGHEARLPVDIMFRRQPNYKPEVSGYARNLQDTLKQVHEHAREHRRATQKRHKDHYDQQIAGEQIEVVDGNQTSSPAPNTPVQRPHV